MYSWLDSPYLPRGSSLSLAENRPAVFFYNNGQLFGVCTRAFSLRLARAGYSLVVPTSIHFAYDTAWLTQALAGFALAGWLAGISTLPAAYLPPEAGWLASS